MAVTPRNILVGHGDLWVADQGAALPTFTANSPSGPDFDADSDWTSVGATQDGVELAYAPDYGEVEVDQMKDAAIMFNQGVTITVNTNLAEATLDNLLIAWGAPDAALSGSTFSLGVPDEEPVERSLAIVGKAPKTGAGVQRERVYYARRVISIEGSNLSMRRTENTAFPISFRLLPDPTFSGAEYGQIIDRAVSA